MIGTDPSGQGGVATVISLLESDGWMMRNGIKIITTHSTKSKNKLVALVLFVFSVVKIVYFGSFERLNVVHVHMSARGSYARKSFIVRLVRLFGSKIIIHLHSGGFKSFYSEQCSSSKQRHIRNTLNMADKVIVLSTQWLAWIETLLDDPSKACVVYNAVPELDLPNRLANKLVILFLGRLGEPKGVDDLIRAFEKVATRFPDVFLDLGGDGDVDKYKAQAFALGLMGRVNFLGWVSGDVKNQCLADATIYVLPSYFEGFPMGVLEAMSANVPVVASTAGGIPDAITSGKEGLLIEAGDVDGLAAALCTLLSEPDTRAEFAKAAHEKFVRSFSPNAIFPQLDAIYNELLSQPK